MGALGLEPKATGRRGRRRSWIQWVVLGSGPRASCRLRVGIEEAPLPSRDLRVRHPGVLEGTLTPGALLPLMLTLASPRVGLQREGARSVPTLGPC